jgi:acyl-coenzyme A synthetase/AMP-(fatty) acid ligase
VQRRLWRRLFRKLTATPLAIYTLEPNSDELKVLNYAQLKKATERLAWHYNALRLPEGASEELPTPGKTNETVGIFFRSSLNLTMTEFALHRLGKAALLISPNNPGSAVAGLLKATDTHVIIAGEKLYDTAVEAVEILKADGYQIELLQEQVFPLFGPNGIAATKVAPYPLRLRYSHETMRTCITLHSSGSVRYRPLYTSSW